MDYYSHADNEIKSVVDGVTFDTILQNHAIHEEANHLFCVGGHNSWLCLNAKNTKR